MLSNFLRPKSYVDDIPPGLPLLPEIPADHDKLLRDTHHEIQHRERVLRALEAKAHVRGNFNVDGG